jgi:hypothetical protein
MKTRVTCLMSVTICLTLATARSVHADNTVCTNAILLVPDGSHQDGTFTAGGQDRWFRFVMKNRRSYAIMLENLSPPDVNAVACMTAPMTACSGGTFLPVSDRLDVEPVSFDGSAGSGRWALQSTSNGEAFFSVCENPGSSGNFRIRVEDTTMFSPAWTTNGTFDTFWSFQNTTNAAIAGTLYLLDAGGSLVMSSSFTINVGGIFGTNTGALAIPRSKVGNAIFTHDGPAGAVVIKANQANFATSPPFIELVPFETVRRNR